MLHIQSRTLFDAQKIQTKRIERFVTAMNHHVLATHLHFLPPCDTRRVLKTWMRNSPRRYALSLKVELEERAGISNASSKLTLTRKSVFILSV